jgi:hypothetical protein
VRCCEALQPCSLPLRSSALLFCVVMQCGCVDFGWRSNTLYFTDGQIESLAPGVTSIADVRSMRSGGISWNSTLPAFETHERILVYHWTKWGTTLGPYLCLRFSSDGVLEEKRTHVDGLFTSGYEKMRMTVDGWLEEFGHQSKSDGPNLP